jgi:hypothetical protein
MNEENMRNMVIYGDQDFQALDELKNLQSWTFHINKTEGHPYYLDNGNTKIYLASVASNVVTTSNVLPQDHMKHHPSFHNDALQILAADLQLKAISYVLGISESDKKLL